MTKVSAVQQQPCQMLSQIQLGAQREDHVPHRDSPTASQRASAMSFAHVQNSCNLVCDWSEVPAAKEPMQTVPPCCGDAGWWPGNLPEPRSTRQHPHCAITCWLRHTSTPCRAIPDSTAPVSQMPAAQADWETGAAHSVLLTCTAVMNSEPANWNINDLVNYRKEPAHSEVCSTIAWLFGMMNTHNSSRFQQEVRGFALL